MSDWNGKNGSNLENWAFLDDWFEKYFDPEGNEFALISSVALYGGRGETHCGWTSYS